MKRLINLFLILIMVMNLTIVGCGKKETNQEVEENESVVETESEEESEGVTVDKNLLTVDITLPPEIVGDLSDFNEEEYLAENEGIKTAEVQEDGSLKLTMTKKKHKELINEAKEEVESNLKEMIESEEMSYVKDVEYNKDFKEVIVMVDKTAYENEDIFNLTSINIGLVVGMYQTYSGKEYNTTVIIEDVDTGDQINKTVYPDDLEE